MVSNLELIFRILASAIIGGIIGLEREINNRSAGLRTHILVTMGASLIMLVSTQGFPGMEGSFDPSRIAAQVVSGVGFLGAGTILISGQEIKGLTTAASLWVCAGLGLAIGAGYYLGGLVTVIIVYITLSILSKLEKKLVRKRYKIINITCSERAGLISDLRQVFGEKSITIKDIKINRNHLLNQKPLIIKNAESLYNVVEVEVTLVVNRVLNYQELNSMLLEVDGVENIS